MTWRSPEREAAIASVPATTRRSRGSRCSRGSSSHTNGARVEAPATRRRVTSSAHTRSPAPTPPAAPPEPRGPPAEAAGDAAVGAELEASPAEGLLPAAGHLLDEG